MLKRSPKQEPFRQRVMHTFWGMAEGYCEECPKLKWVSGPDKFAYCSAYDAIMGFRFMPWNPRWRACGLIKEGENGKQEGDGD